LKYFTKEIYEAMQVVGYLAFPEKEEDLIESKEWYISVGRNYEAECMRSFENIKPYLIKYLPEDMKPHMMNGDLLGIDMPSNILISKIIKFRNDYEEQWDQLNKDYYDKYQEIREQLSDNVRNMYETIDFHDAKIEEIKENADEIEIRLNCSGCMEFNGNCKLTFTGVNSKKLPDSRLFYWCLYSEIYNTSMGDFELRILVDSCTGYLGLEEIIIEAKDVILEEIEEEF
jgi:hypothetical protein